MIYLLDTDILTLAHQRKRGLRERIERVTPPDDVALPVSTRVEVLTGRLDMIRKASTGADLLRAVEWLRQSEEFLAEFDVVPSDDTAAARYDELRANKKLKKIDNGDLIAASVALATAATLVTRNTKDFAPIPGLRIENWAD